MLALNGVPLAYTVVGRATGTSQIVGMSLVTTSSTNSTLNVENPSGNFTALTITPLAGGTQSVAGEPRDHADPIRYTQPGMRNNRRFGLTSHNRFDATASSIQRMLTGIPLAPPPSGIPRCYAARVVGEAGDGERHGEQFDPRDGGSDGDTRQVADLETQEDDLYEGLILPQGEGGTCGAQIEERTPAGGEDDQVAA